MGLGLGGNPSPQQGGFGQQGGPAVPAGPGANQMIANAGMNAAPQQAAPPPSNPTMAPAAGAAPADPTQFLPGVFSQPYTSGVQAGQNIASFGSQALPNITGFQQALFSPNMTPMEGQYAQAATDLGLRGLAQTQANIMGQFENSGFHSAMAPLLMNSANQFSDQINQLIGQMGTNRMGIAAQQMLPSMGFPLQALQAGQASAEGLYGMANNAMMGDVQFPFAMYGSTPFSAPTVIAQPGGGGKGK